MQEKELIERHNVWLNDELAAKVDSLIKLRRAHADIEAEMSFKLSDVSAFYIFYGIHNLYISDISMFIYIYIFFLGILAILMLSGWTEIQWLF